jgi:hypothetical protein
VRDNQRRPPSREELEGLDCRLVKEGGKYKADLLEIDLGDGLLAVKDYAGKGWLFRQIGRLLIRRECGAYHWLSRQPGIPALVGRIDLYAMALKRVDGQPLDDATCPPQDGPAIFERLTTVVRSLHQRGLVHWDLRTRKNVVVGPERQVFVLDFASAVWLRPGGIAHRLLFGAFRPGARCGSFTDRASERAERTHPRGMPITRYRDAPRNVGGGGADSSQSLDRDPTFVRGGVAK